MESREAGIAEQTYFAVGFAAQIYIRRGDQRGRGFMEKTEQHGAGCHAPDLAQVLQVWRREPGLPS